MPPAKANANGRNPAARRACEIETRSESGGEEERHQHHREHRERPAGDVGSPAASRREAGQRDEQQRRDRDRTGAREDLGREVVGRRRSGRRAGRCTARRRAAARPRQVIPSACRSRSGGSQSMKSAAGHDERGERERRRSARSARSTAHARRGSPTNGIQRKIAYVGWTTARASPAAAVDASEPGGRRPHRLQRERERGRHEELTRRGRRQSEEDVGAAVPGAKQIIATCARGADARGPASGGTAPSRPRTRRRRRAARGSTAGGRRPRSGSSPESLAIEREEAVPERERVAGMQAAVRELRHAVERRVRRGRAASARERGGTGRRPDRRARRRQQQQPDAPRPRRAHQRPARRRGSPGASVR